MSHLPLDARAILEYLNELGYRNISAEQLKEFIKDLRKLIKYEDNLSVNAYQNDYFENLYKRTTASYRAKVDKEKANNNVQHNNHQSNGRSEDLRGRQASADSEMVKKRSKSKGRKSKGKQKKEQTPKDVATSNKENERSTSSSSSAVQTDEPTTCKVNLPNDKKIMEHMVNRLADNIDANFTELKSLLGNFNCNTTPNVAQHLPRNSENGCHWKDIIAQQVSLDVKRDLLQRLLKEREAVTTNSGEKRPESEKVRGIPELNKISTSDDGNSDVLPQRVKSYADKNPQWEAATDIRAALAEREPNHRPANRIDEPTGKEMLMPQLKKISTSQKHSNIFWDYEKADIMPQRVKSYADKRPQWDATTNIRSASAERGASNSRTAERAKEPISSSTGAKIKPTERRGRTLDRVQTGGHRGRHRSESPYSKSSGSLISRNYSKSRSRKPLGCDPVALYQYYQQEWKYFRKHIPGENSHADLRWKIRHKLLDPE